MARIDHDHQAYFDLLDTISAAIENDAGKERTLRLICEMAQFVEFHFMSEENLMIDTNYDEYPTHKSDHLFWLDRMKLAISDLEAGTVNAKWVIHDMRDWFAIHHSKQDHKFESYLKST